MLVWYAMTSAIAHGSHCWHCLSIVCGGRLLKLQLMLMTKPLAAVDQTLPLSDGLVDAKWVEIETAI